METVTQASLLDAIRQAMGGNTGPDDAMTIQELVCGIVDRNGGSIEYTARKLRPSIPKLIADGVLERVKVRRESVDGRQIVAVAFRFRG